LVDLSMSSLGAIADGILDEIKRAISSLEADQVEKMISMIMGLRDHRIFVVGAGRSGLIGRAFAMRLMHLGFNVYVVGETITPAFEKGDLLLAISGSGTTTSVIDAAKASKKIGGKVLVITSYPGSPLGRIADHNVVLKSKTKLGEGTEAQRFSAPLGTLFEASCLVFLDSIVVELMRRLSKTEEDMKRMHSTIE